MSDASTGTPSADHDAEDGTAPQATRTTALSTADTSDIDAMGYEQARDELAGIVSTLESGRSPLEESMRLWERGEALAAHCQRWLDGAQTRIEEAVERRESRTGA